jgi:RNA polymerase sigma-70 factor (ECF subfamily)
MSDSSLIHKLALGDPGAFEELYRRHKAAVYGLSRRLLQEPGLAEDNTQETWMKVVRSAASYQDQGNPQAWILQITRNTALTTLRKRGWEKESVEDMVLEVEDDRFNAEEILGRAETRAQLQKAISLLPERQRVILVLWLSEDRTMEELAADLQTNINAAKVLLHRAKKSLLKLLETGGLE